jgi:flagellar motor switch protein FliN
MSDAPLMDQSEIDRLMGSQDSDETGQAAIDQSEIDRLMGGQGGGTPSSGSDGAGSGGLIDQSEIDMLISGQLGGQTNVKKSAPPAPKPAPSAPPRGGSKPSNVTINPAQFAPLDANNGPGTEMPANIDLLLDIGLTVSVELGRSRMRIQDILSLGPDKIVELDRVAGEPVDVLINGKPIAKGEVVVIGDMFGVRITDIISPAQRVESMRQ